MRPSLLVAALVLPVALLACGAGGDSDDLAPDGGGGAGGTGGEDPIAVQPRLTCDLATLDFGVVRRGAASTLSVRCRNDGDGPWTLAVGAVDDVAVAVSPSPLAQPGESWELAVTWDPGTSGPWAVELPLRDGDGDLVLALELRGEAVDHCLVGAGSDSVDFGTIEPGTSRIASLTFQRRCRAGGPSAITSVMLDAASHQNFTWTPDEYPIELPAAVDGVNGSVSIDVEFFARADESGRRNGWLVFTTNDASISRIDILLTGFIAAP